MKEARDGSEPAFRQLGKPDIRPKTLQISENPARNDIDPPETNTFLILFGLIIIHLPSPLNPFGPTKQVNIAGPLRCRRVGRFLAFANRDRFWGPKLSNWVSRRRDRSPPPQGWRREPRGTILEGRQFSANRLYGT